MNFRRLYPEHLVGYEHNVTIKNVGTAPTNGTTLIIGSLSNDMQAYGRGIHNYIIYQPQLRSLAPGERETLSPKTSLICITGESFPTSAKVDPYNNIFESNENNNVHTSTFTCPITPTHHLLIL